MHPINPMMNNLSEHVGGSEDSMSTTGSTSTNTPPRGKKSNGDPVDRKISSTTSNISTTATATTTTTTTTSITTTNHNDERRDVQHKARYAGGDGYMYHDRFYRTTNDHNNSNNNDNTVAVVSGTGSGGAVIIPNHSVNLPMQHKPVDGRFVVVATSPITTTTKKRTMGYEENSHIVAIATSPITTTTKETNHHGQRQRWKKEVGKPRHPLTAYNIFFFMYRQRLLSSAFTTTGTSNQLTNITIVDIAYPSSTITAEDITAFFGPPTMNCYYDEIIKETPFRLGVSLPTAGNGTGKGTKFSQLVKLVADAWRMIDPISKEHLQQRAKIYQDQYRIRTQLWQQETQSKARARAVAITLPSPLMIPTIEVHQDIGGGTNTTPSVTVHPLSLSLVAPIESTIANFKVDSTNTTTPAINWKKTVIATPRTKNSKKKISFQEDATTDTPKDIMDKSNDPTDKSNIPSTAIDARSISNVVAKSFSDVVLPIELNIGNVNEDELSYSSECTNNTIFTFQMGPSSEMFKTHCNCMGSGKHHINYLREATDVTTGNKRLRYVTPEPIMNPPLSVTVVNEMHDGDHRLRRHHQAPEAYPMDIQTNYHGIAHNNLVNHSYLQQRHQQQQNEWNQRRQILSQQIHHFDQVGPLGSVHPHIYRNSEMCHGLPNCSSCMVRRLVTMNQSMDYFGNTQRNLQQLPPTYINEFYSIIAPHPTPISTSTRHSNANYNNMVPTSMDPYDERDSTSPSTSFVSQNQHRQSNVHQNDGGSGMTPSQIPNFQYPAHQRCTTFRQPGIFYFHDEIPSYNSFVSTVPQPGNWPDFQDPTRTAIRTTNSHIDIKNQLPYSYEGTPQRPVNMPYPNSHYYYPFNHGMNQNHLFDANETGNSDDNNYF